MKKNLRAAALIALMLSVLPFAACGDSDKVAQKPTEPDWTKREPVGPEVMGTEWDLVPNADVYIVGSSRRLFKNGVTYALGLADERIRNGNSVCVSDGDVYVACDTYPPALGSGPGAILWKNGVAVPLEGGTDYSYFARGNEVAVSNGNSYVAGNYDTTPFLWMNGKPQPLEFMFDTSSGEAECVTVSGKDVYVGGQDINTGRIWKNGVSQELGYNLGGRNLKIQSIFVSGDDVYAGGEDIVDDYRLGLKMRPLIWKNGVFQILPHDGDHGAVNSVFVSGDDFYALGCEYAEKGFTPRPVLWKNGALYQKLTPDGSGFASASSLFISGGNLYVAGYTTFEVDGIDGRYCIPTLWINGEAVDLRPYGLTDMVWSVFVVEKGK